MPPSGLWQTSGWIRGTCPFVASADSPSGACSLSATLTDEVGLDLSRKRVDVCLISDQGELLGHFPAPVDRDGLSGLARRVAVYGQPVRGVIESMNGARVVHHELVGWPLCPCHESAEVETVGSRTT